MKQQLLNSFKLRAVMLVAILCAGFTSAWGDTVTFDATTDVTEAAQSYQSTEKTYTATDGSEWKANGYGATANTSLVIGKGGANYLQTPNVNGTITSVDVTWSGNSSYYLALQTTAGTELGAIKNPSTSTTKTFTVSGSYSQLRLVGRRSSGTSNAAATITKVVVTYTTAGGGTPTPSTYTVTYDANGGTGTMTDPDSPYEAENEVTLLANTFTAPDGKVWDSWSVKDASNNAITVSNGKFTMPASNVTVSAQWVDDPNATQYEWVETSLADLTSTDVFVIVGNNFAMTNNNGTSSAPATSAVTVANSKIESTITDNIKWNVSGNATDGYTFYPNGSTTTWLYCNTEAASGSNNNIRVGSGSRKIFELNNSGYLITKDTYTDRYLSIYSDTDWRGYVNTNYGAVALKFYKRQVASNDPSIYASDPEMLDYDATSGEFGYSITNPTSATLTATSNSDWITDVVVDGTNSKVTFSTTANPNTTQRTGSITLSYTGADSKVVTITQAAAPVIYTTIPALFAAATKTETDVRVTFGGWVVSAVHNNNAYLTDNQGNGLIIYASGHGFQVNDVLTGTVSCKLNLFNGSAELTNLTTSTEDLTVTQNGSVTAKTIAISNLGGVNTGALLSFEGLTYNGTALVDGDNNAITPWTTLFSGTFENGKSYDVTGIYLQYNDTKEILPRSATDIVEVQVQHQEYDLAVTLNDNVSAIYVYNATDQSNPLIAGGAAGTVKVADATQVLISPDVASGYVLGSLTVDGVDVTEEMNEGSYSFTMPTHAVTITATAVPVKTYTLASTITSGKHYIIVNNNAGRAMGEQASNNRQAGGVTISGQTASVASEANVVEFVIYGPDADGYYTIYDAAEGGYLYAASSSSNQLKTQTTNDDNGRWSISIEESVASIVAQGDKERNVMQYNSSSKLFACYGSASQQPVYLYEKDGEATPTESKTLNDYGYATYASQNALDFTNATDVTAWTITGINGNEITFSQIEGSAPAGTGLFLKGEASGSVTMTSATGASALTGNLLEGIIADKTITAGEYFGLKGNEFVPVNAGTVPAGKALLPASEVPAEIKAFTFVFNSADGIKTVETVNVAEAEEIFNIAGQRLQKAQRGLNIIGGRKVVIK